MRAEYLFHLKVAEFVIRPVFKDTGKRKFIGNRFLQLAAFAEQATGFAGMFFAGMKFVSGIYDGDRIFIGRNGYVLHCVSILNL